MKLRRVNKFDSVCVLKTGVPYVQCNALYTSQYEKKKTFFDGKEKETATELRTFSKKRWNSGTCFAIDVNFWL